MAGDAVDAEGFTQFMCEVEPRLRRAFVGSRGLDGAYDATAEALAWAWENWSEVKALENPVGYLYRVGQSRSRTRKQGHLPAVVASGVPDVEPGLVPALRALSDQQRTAVWLVHGCGWSYEEAAEAMAITASAVGTHVSRALSALRQKLEVNDAPHR